MTLDLSLTLNYGQSMQRPIRHLIRSADDYGLRKAATQAILALAQEQALDRVAVVTQNLTPEDAQALASTGVKLDLHLELISLLGRGGETTDSTIGRVFQFLGCILRGQLRTTLVEQNWAKQIAQFQTLFGRLPDGFNSHEHVHFFPPFFKILTRLAQHHRIAYVRFGQKGVLSGKTIVRKILATLWCLNQRTFLRSNLTSSDYLISYNWIGDLSALKRSIPYGTTEVVLHPENPLEHLELKHQTHQHT